MIHLVNMPFAFLTYPNLALGAIKSQLLLAGLETKILNLNISFAKKIGFGQYSNISFMKDIDPRMSEWLFSQEAWGEPFAPYEEEYLTLCAENLRSGHKIRENRNLLLHIRKEIVPQWLVESLGSFDFSGEFHGVGFTCGFFQTIPSLALARLIKKRRSDVKIVFGGPCVHAEMGEEIFSKTPWVDAVSLGEADDVVVELFSAISRGRDPEELQGVLWRDNHGMIHKGEKPRPVSTQILNRLPAPDFDDFFADAEASGLSREPQWKERVFLPFESARGCWKAKRQHCRFCGAAPHQISSREKSARKVLSILEQYIERYPVRRFHATDINLSVGFFRTLFPSLKPVLKNHGVSLFYEVTSRLGRGQIKDLADTGVIFVQAGVESLGTRLLRLMNKGVTALENVFFLKCCAQHGVLPLWNFLIGVPGERHEDYQAMEKLIPLIYHLRPPVGKPSPIQCHRFSPYFEQLDRWARNIRPQPWCKGLFPSDRIQLERVAYYFDADWKNVLSPEDYRAVTEKTAEWINRWKTTRPRLTARRENNGELKIEDTRTDEPKTWCLDAGKAGIYKQIADPGYASEIACREKLSVVLDEFVDNGLAIEENGRYLALAVNEEV